MMNPKKFRRDRSGPRPTVEDRGGLALIRLGPANIWDAGDLGRLREAASRLFARGTKRVGIDLSHVGMLPSGFMNQLCGWHDRGIEVLLYAPRPNVREMFWFRQFVEFAGNDLWRMACEPTTEDSTRDDASEQDRRSESVDRTRNGRLDGASLEFVVHAGMNVEPDASRHARGAAARSRQLDHA